MERPLESEVDVEHGPHVEEYLGNVLYVIFSQWRLDGIATGCKFSIMYSSDEDL